MPTYKVEDKFAWRPVLTTSGKWIWWKKYIKLFKFYWGPSGESPATDTEIYTEGEWFLEKIKTDYTNPPKFFKTAIKTSKGP